MTDWPHHLSHGIALKSHLSYEEALVLEAELRPAIERIEQEARADLAARIVAAVEGLPHGEYYEWPDGRVWNPVNEQDVLRVIREEASDDRRA